LLLLNVCLVRFFLVWFSGRRFVCSLHLRVLDVTFISVWAVRYSTPIPYRFLVRLRYTSNMDVQLVHHHILRSLPVYLPTNVTFVRLFAVCVYLHVVTVCHYVLHATTVATLFAFLPFAFHVPTFAFDSPFLTAFYPSFPHFVCCYVVVHTLDSQHVLVPTFRVVTWFRDVPHVSRALFCSFRVVV